MSGPTKIRRDIRCPRCGFFVDEDIDAPLIAAQAGDTALVDLVTERVAALDTPSEIVAALVLRFDITVKA